MPPIPNPEVGRRFEVAIDGVGYMLDDDADDKAQYQRATIPLDPQRLATSDTPFAEAVERYTFTAFDDFSGGYGQARQSASDADPTGFFRSANVDVFNDAGGLRLVPKVEDVVALSVSQYCSMIEVGGLLYILFPLSTTEWVFYNYAPDGTVNAGPVSITDTGLGQFPALASAGTQVYVAYKDEIRTLSSAGVLGAALWTAPGAITALEYGHGRLLVGYRVGTVASFTTVTVGGSEEVPGGRYTADVGNTFLGQIAVSPGSVHFAVSPTSSGGRSQIFSWNVAADAPVLVDESATPERWTGLFYVNGQLFVYASENEELASFANTLNVYRCPVAADGSLTRFLVHTTGGRVPASIGATVVGQRMFTVWENLVLFPVYGNQDTLGSFHENGIWAIDLETSNVAHYWSIPEYVFPGEVLTWRGMPTWFQSAGTDKVVTTVADEYEPLGMLQTSIVDGGSALAKQFDAVRLLSEPLAASTAVSVKVSDDSYATLTAIADAALGPAGTSSEGSVAVTAQSLGVELTLTTSDGVSTPVVQLAQLQMHPVGLADQVLVLPIACSDRVRDYLGTPMDANGADHGGLRAQTLEGLVNAQVQVQDVDWRITGALETWEVEQVQVSKRAVFNRQRQSAHLKMTAVVQLRRPT